jgi:kumamolisin
MVVRQFVTACVTIARASAIDLDCRRHATAVMVAAVGQERPPMKKISFLACCAALAGCASSAPVAGRSENPRLSQARDLGPAPRDNTYRMVIGLRMPALDRLNSFLAKRDPNGDVFSPADFADTFAASASDYAQMATWLRSHGLTVERTTAGRTTITVSGSTDAFEHAFGSPVHSFSDASGEFDAFVKLPNYPIELSGIVSGEIGLDGEPKWFSHRIVPSPTDPQLSVNTSLNAWDIEQLYQTATITGTFPSGTNTPKVATPGMGETIAILGAGGAPQLNTDINGTGGYMTRYKPYGLSSLPATGGGYSIVNVGGPSRDGMQADAGEYGENVLDIDMVLAMAPYAKIVHVLTATNSPGLFTDGISYIVNQLPAAHTVSVSYGGCERYSSTEMPVMSALMAQAKAQGQVWFFASGDSGTDGCREVDPNNPTGPGMNKIISAGWPASDPNVIGVGGTQLQTINNKLTEVAWVNGGGAPSESFDKPAYQMGKTPADNARDEPDVAALAGSPYIKVVDNGTAAAVGGTSAATPMWAGIWALLDQAKGGGGLKMAHEKLYPLGGGTSFTDVTSGTTNGPDGVAGSQPGESAGTGYDLATGWGTPILPNLISNWN